MSSATTSLRLSWGTLADALGGSFAGSSEGAPIDQDGEKTITVDAVDSPTLTAAITTTSAAFVARDTAIADAATALRQAYPTIRQWAQDAAPVNTNWPTMTANQKDAAMRNTIQRLGVFLDRFGDLLQALNADA